MSAAELLEYWGRVDEAIEIIRARMEAGHSMALESYARLLARRGRSDEAFILLQPHINDPSLGRALVDVSEDAGRDEDVAALLIARIPAEHRCTSPWCCRALDPDTAIGLLATIRERQGRVDEAIALLRTRNVTSLNGRDQLAEHERIEELRAYAAADSLGHAERRLAEALEERGDVEGAIAVYRHAGDSAAARPNSTVLLAHLLARHGRGDEAIDVMRALAEARSGDDCILHTLSTLYAEQHRPEDGLVHLDALAARRRGGEEGWDVFWMRLPLMAACGRVDEAVELALAHPEGRTSYAAPHIAKLLAGVGRIEEAVAVLEQHAFVGSRDLAGYLIDLSRVEDALAVLQRRTPQSAALSGDPWGGDPPF